MRALLFAALLPPLLAADPLRSGCFDDAKEIGTVTPLDRLEVQSALAGAGPTCYHVRVTQPGGTLNGYILGDSLPAIQRFISSRERVAEDEARAEARQAREVVPEKAADAEQASTTPADPLLNTRFEDFVGTDNMGRPVTLAGLKGRVTVVTFWSPDDPHTMSNLQRELPLYNEFHDDGLAVVGVCTQRGADVSEALDDITLPFPQMADPGGLTARYGVDPKAGKTFVLDADHRIVAAGPAGPAIDKAVRQLMGDPANQ